MPNSPEKAYMWLLPDDPVSLARYENVLETTMQFNMAHFRGVLAFVHLNYNGVRFCSVHFQFNFWCRVQ